MSYQRLLFIYSLLIGLVAATGPHPGYAQSKPIKRMGSVNTTSFDDGWLFARYGLQADGTRKEEPSGLEAVSMNDAKWQKLDLPHDWAITGPFRIELEGATGKLPWKGIGWYRKHFTVPVTDAGKHIFVDFDGAMANAKIWLNGKYVGTWPYGYTSFRMDLTPFIQPGKENILAVRLDTENWDSRWYPGAGIYRHVWLVKTNAVHVDHWGTYITTPQITNKDAAVNIAVTVSNQSKKNTKAIIHTTLFELNAANQPTTKVAVIRDAVVDLNAGENKIVETKTTIINPKRWSIESPNRYVAQTQIIVNGKTIDTYNTPFGVRTIEFTARNGFLLNGKRVEIKGTCNHHDLGALGAAFNLSALTRQLNMLKAMGCNSLRTSHNPPTPELLELADKMGFLVWDEAFDAWKKGKRKNDYNKLFDEWHDKDITALIRRDRNHPSVFIWSIGNEVMEQQNVELTKHLVDIMHREDPTRPVSNGYNDPDGGRNSGAVVALDIMGVNYFFGQQPKWDADPRYANKPTVGSETSSCVTSRGEYFFGGNEYQNWQISSYDYAKPGWGCSPDEQFRINAKFPHLLGEYVWTGFDYLGEPTPYNSDETNLLNFRTDPSKKAELEKQLEALRQKKPPSRSSYFGIIDLAGFPKDRFYSYQSHWRPELPVAHIFPHWNWPERIDSITPVHVYTSGDEAELFLNGKSLGRKTKKAGQDFRLIWDDVTYTPGELKVVCYKNGKQWATDVVKTTGGMKKLALTADRSVIRASEDELCFITVKVTDKDGLMVPRSNPVVHFSIEGAGEIVATDNGDATSFVPFQSHERPAFNGMALVIVKTKKGMKGKVIVKASSKGLVTGQAIIAVQ
jgi:beta-galactosidase